MGKPTVLGLLDSSYELNQTIEKWIEPDTTQVSCCEPNRQTRTVVVLPGAPQVPPDNNQAERSLRLAVTK